MPAILQQPSLPTPLPLAEKPRKQAKATLKGVRKAENASQWQKWGTAIEYVQCEFRLTLKEFAAELKKDERQVQRWIEAKERPQIETVMAVPRFEPVMLIALAQRTDGVQVDTVIHVKRSA